ncbi:nucleoside diphosphate kinase homolog 5 [Neosynchiropus ocellatus]
MEESEFYRIHVEKTLAILKPDVVHVCDEIEDVILKSGFSILQKRKVQLTPEQCSDFYADHYGKLFFSGLTAYMSSGPIIVMSLAREDAVAHWKSIIGPASSVNNPASNPDCLRARYGTTDLKNGLHGSESQLAAERELKFMFPNTTLESFVANGDAEEYLSKFVNPTLIEGLTELCKHKPINDCVWLADWLLEHNPNHPRAIRGNVQK